MGEFYSAKYIDCFRCYLRHDCDVHPSRTVRVMDGETGEDAGCGDEGGDVWTYNPYPAGEDGTETVWLWHRPSDGEYDSPGYADEPPGCPAPTPRAKP